MLLCNHANAGQLQQRHRVHSGSFASTSLPRPHCIGHSRGEAAWGVGYQRHICRQPRSNGSSTDSLTAMEIEQPHGQGFNGGPSPSAVFETARMQVPLFQALSEKEGQQTEGISVEHIPGFASVGSNIYEVSSLHNPADMRKHAVGSQQVRLLCQCMIMSACSALNGLHKGPVRLKPGPGWCSVSCDCLCG